MGIWRFLFLIGCLSNTFVFSQAASGPIPAEEQFRKSLQEMVDLPGLEGASISWSFRTMEGGKEIEFRNSRLMMIPASTAKLYTSVAALDILGPDFRYSTRMYLEGEIHRNRLNGNVVIVGSGDPSLGHRNQQVMSNFRSALNLAEIERIRGRVEADPFMLPYDQAIIPRDRAWEDMANYYGGGVYGINWRNNSLTMRFRPLIGDSVGMEALEPFNYSGRILNSVNRGEEEEIYFFPEPFSDKIQVIGGVGGGVKSVEERMAMPNPPLQFVTALSDTLEKAGIEVKHECIVRESAYHLSPGDTLLSEYFSATLSELLKEVNGHSNNLYAEAIARTTGMNLGSKGSAEESCKMIRRYLIKKGLTGDSLFLLREGSGLGRRNLLCTSGMTDLLQRAVRQPWFSAFEASLSEAGQSGTLKSFKSISGLKAKTGSMGGVRAYAGYLNDSQGNRIAFSIIINHYLDGSGIRKQVEKVLESASKCSF